MDDTFKGLRGKIYAKRVVSNHFRGQRGSAASIGKHFWWPVDFGRPATRCTRMGKDYPRRSWARSSSVTDRSNQVPPQGASSAHARTGEISGARRDSAIARPARGSPLTRPQGVRTPGGLASDLLHSTSALRAGPEEPGPKQTAAPGILFARETSPVSALLGLGTSEVLEGNHTCPNQERQRRQPEQPHRGVEDFESRDKGKCSRQQNHRCDGRTVTW